MYCTKYHLLLVLVDRLAAREVWVGPEFRFGHRRAGDLALLQALGQAHGFQANAIEPVVAGGERVSSTALRQQLAAGDLDGAARDLSAPLPTLRDDYIYSRTPCTDPHSDARLAAAVNVLAVIAIIGGWIWVARRASPQPASPASDPILA